MTTVTHDMTIMDTPLKEIRLTDITEEVSFTLRCYADHISIQSSTTTPISFRFPDLPSDGQKLINKLVYILSEMATYREAGFAVYDGMMVIELGSPILADHVIDKPFSQDKKYPAIKPNVYDGTRLFLYVDGEYISTSLVFATRGVRAIPSIYIEQLMDVMNEHHYNIKPKTKVASKVESFLKVNQPTLTQSMA